MIIWIAIGIGSVVAYVAIAGLVYRVVGGWSEPWNFDSEWKDAAIIAWPVALVTLTLWYVIGVPLRATFRLTSHTMRGVR